MTLRTFLSTTIILAVAYFGFVSQAYALTVSPARLEIAGEPGTTVGGEIVLFNEQAEQKTFYFSSENFEAQGESGAPNFVRASEGLATWIGAGSEITLPAGATETVPFSITIPSDARPGGHFAAIFWGTNPPASDGGQVTVGARVGVLILLRVAGDITENGGISEFDTADSDHFNTKKQASFVYRFQNAGDDRLLPEGTLTIKNTFGGTVDVLDANQSLGNVLPGSVRKFTIDWNGGVSDEKLTFKQELKQQLRHFGLGRYTAKLSLAYGTESKTETRSTVFWVFSWHVVVCALLILAVLFFGGRFVVRRYNKWIINKAQQFLLAQQKAMQKQKKDNDEDAPVKKTRTRIVRQ